MTRNTAVHLDVNAGISQSTEHPRQHRKLTGNEASQGRKRRNSKALDHKGPFAGYSTSYDALGSSMPDP